MTIDYYLRIKSLAGPHTVGKDLVDLFRVDSIHYQIVQPYEGTGSTKAILRPFDVGMPQQFGLTGLVGIAQKSETMPLVEVFGVRTSDGVVVEKYRLEGSSIANFDTTSASGGHGAFANVSFNYDKLTQTLFVHEMGKVQSESHTVTA